MLPTRYTLHATRYTLLDVEHKTLGNTLPDVITEPLINTLV